EKPRVKLVQDWERQRASSEELKDLIKMFERSHSSEAVLFKELAKLYDTFGTPPDLSRVMLEQRLQNYFVKTWIQHLEPDFVMSNPDGSLVVVEAKFNERFSSSLQELQQTSSVGK